MATEGGIKTILNEANYHGEELAETLSELPDFFEKIFWVYFNRPQYLQNAYRFLQVDSIALSRWEEYRTIAAVAAKTDQETLTLLEQHLGAYFLLKEGRGKHCAVEHYRRNDLDYFFIYPADYPRASMEWQNGQFDRTTRQLAFEMILVYSQTEQKISLHSKIRAKAKEEVQKTFADVALGLKQDGLTKNNKVFELTSLLDANKQFKFQPESGVQNIAVKKLVLMVLGSNDRITLETKPTDDPQAVYKLMEKTCKGFNKSKLSVVRTALVVTFYPDDKGKAKTCTFEVGWPNTCSLQHHKHEATIRKMLIDSGIDIAQIQ